MLRLMLFRHAKSDRPAGVEDHERPLAHRGREESALMGRRMAREGLVPDLVSVSTSVRTRETWTLARPAFLETPARRDEPRLYNASAKTVLAVAREADSSIASQLLIGHNPGLYDLAVRLVGKGDAKAMVQLHDGLPTAGLVVIDFDVPRWSDIDDGLGTLMRFDTPGAAR